MRRGVLKYESISCIHRIRYVKELRDKTVKICRPRYILETFFNGEKSCLEAMSISGNDNFLLDSGAFSYMNGAQVTLAQMDSYIDKIYKIHNQSQYKTLF